MTQFAAESISHLEDELKLWELSRLSSQFPLTVSEKVEDLLSPDIHKELKTQEDFYGEAIEKRKKAYENIVFALDNGNQSLSIKMLDEYTSTLGNELSFIRESRSKLASIHNGVKKMNQDIPNVLNKGKLSEILKEVLIEKPNKILEIYLEMHEALIHNLSDFRKQLEDGKIINDRSAKIQLQQILIKNFSRNYQGNVNLKVELQEAIDQYIVSMKDLINFDFSDFSKKEKELFWNKISLIPLIIGGISIFVTPYHSQNLQTFSVFSVGGYLAYYISKKLKEKLQG